MTTDTEFDVDTADKDALAEYAFKHFARPLDKRKRIDLLQGEVKALMAGDTQRAEAVEAELVAEETRRKERSPKLVRHVKNGHVFEWTPLYKGNQDLEIIEWE